MSNKRDAKADHAKHPHTAAGWLRGALLGLGVISSAACADLAPEDDEPALGTIESAVTVADYTTGTCSTSTVLGLSKQIAEEVGCLGNTSLVRFAPGGNLQFTSNAVLPYLSTKAKNDLQAVAASRTVQVNSGFRTVAQQYLLYRWYQAGRCGITAAARPGRSNHESGRALDVANYSSLVSAMGARGWSHSVPGDPVHFDHLGSTDIRGKDVLAFQRLWNRNNPGEKITEDGLYGPQTESALRRSPATGFAQGASCSSGKEDGGEAVALEVLTVQGPDRIAVGAREQFTFTVANQSSTDWPASAKLVVSGGAASELYDSGTWVSPSEIGPIQLDIPAGEQGVIDVRVVAPTVTEETPVFTQLLLVDDGGATLGTMHLAVTVTPNGDEDISGEGDDQHDNGGEAVGGCSAGGSLGWLGLVLPALMLGRRRRRA